MQTGLVLEGGGVRGIYVAGILDVFLEQEIGFDGVIGVSAGAIHGCSYLSGQNGRSIRYYSKYCADPRFMSLRNWLRTGNILDPEFCYHDIPDKLDIYDHDAFERCGVPFYVVCSDVETGKPEYFHMTDMRSQIDLLRASASLPYASSIVEFGGRKLLDGGCTDSIPVEKFREMGYQRNVVVLTRPADYRKKHDSGTLAKLVYRKYPAFAKALANRDVMYNRTVERIQELEQEGSIFVIRPREALNIGRLERNVENVRRVYETGRADAVQCLANLKKWLSE